MSAPSNFHTHPVREMFTQMLHIMYVDAECTTITFYNTSFQLPVSSLFNLINVYLFLPISRKDVAVCIGMAISVITISATAISEVNHSQIVMI